MVSPSHLWPILLTNQSPQNWWWNCQLWKYWQHSHKINRHGQDWHWESSCRTFRGKCGLITTQLWISTVNTICISASAWRLQNTNADVRNKAYATHVRYKYCQHEAVTRQDVQDIIQRKVRPKCHNWTGWWIVRHLWNQVKALWVQSHQVILTPSWYTYLPHHICFREFSETKFKAHVYVYLQTPGTTYNVTKIIEMWLPPESALRFFSHRLSTWLFADSWISISNNTVFFGQWLSEEVHWRHHWNLSWFRCTNRICQWYTIIFKWCHVS